jgi:hypothetical protein
VTACKDVYTFLSQVSSRTVTATLTPADAQHLADLGLVAFLTADQYRALGAEVETLGAAQAALAQEMAERARLAGTLQHDVARTHSVLFHLHGKDKQTEELQQESQDRTSFQTMESDLAAKEKAFNELVGKRSLYDTLIPYGDQYVGLTSVGQLQVRDLGVRLYRVGDSDFDEYWAQAQRITERLNTLADEGSNYFARLAPAITDADRSYLWAVSLGLSKTQPDPAAGAPRFAEAYNGIAGLSGNPENRLMATEILFAISRPISEEVPSLAQLVRDVRALGVSSESALGVAAMLLYGQRGDGTFATSTLAEYLQVTKSFESAALMAIMNVPVPDLVTKFRGMQAMFASWGYEQSEDVELSSAYLSVSELPIEGMSTKLSIIARGMSTYLQYPLVSASVLASVATLEANETLNLLEQAYNVVGRRALGMNQAELVCLAVRMVEGIRNELVGALDTTATAPTGAARPAPLFVRGPYFVPIIVMHNAYYSTYSGVSGPHPGHAHGFAGGGFTG